MDERSVVTVFLRNRGEILLCRRSDAVGSYPGRWGGVAGHAEGDPPGAARQEIHEETGIDPDRTECVRAGEAFAVEDTERGTRWVVRPFLFDCPTRDTEPNWETDRTEWVPPPAILDRETVPDLWTAYDRVRPTVETIVADREHGSTYLSVRALDVLRDEAALLARGQSGVDGDATEGDGFAAVTDIARELLAARPSMAAVTNRVARVLHDADTAASVEHAAHAAIDRALRVDHEAATVAADLLDGDRVATLSRSGTVSETLEAAAVEHVLVAESRPGREGVAVAERLAAGTDVTLTTDAGFAHALATQNTDTLLVGADAVLADGRVLNKVGTRSAALAAAHEGIRVLVATASDKIRPGTDADLEARSPAEVYDGTASVSVVNPTFDVTPAACLDAVVTERGPLDSAAVAAIADEHRALRAWDEE
jgi:translation initiation factor 2B subunit (eIF-2B alpha/beta/delta family)